MASRSSKLINLPFPLPSTIDLVERRTLASLLILSKNCIRSYWSTFLTMDICAALVNFARRRSRLRFFTSSSACASCVMIRSCNEVKAYTDTGVTGVAGVVCSGINQECRALVSIDLQLLKMDDSRGLGRTRSEERRGEYGVVSARMSAAVLSLNTGDPVSSRDFQSRRRREQVRQACQNCRRRKIKVYLCRAVLSRYHDPNATHSVMKLAQHAGPV